MKKTALILSKIATAIAALFSLYLFVNAIHYTFNMNLYYFEGISFMTEGPDSRLKNLIFIALSFIGAFVLCKLLFLGCKDKNSKNRRVFIASILSSLIVLAGLVYFVVKTHIAVECDQYEVFICALDFAKGDFSWVGDYYIQMYPQQLGLAFFESFFLHFTQDWLIFQILNAVFVAASIFFICRVSHEAFENPYVSFVTLLMTLLCFPLYYYVSFVYGDVFMIFASLFISWALIKYIKTSKRSYGILMIAAAVVMVPIRKNSLVFLIAVAGELVIFSLLKKKAAPLIMAALILVIPYLSNEAIVKGYEIRSGSKVENGMPAINWIAMGLYPAINENCSVGVYNMYNEITYFNANRDKKVSSQMSKDYINQRMSEFKADKKEAYAFFRFKILEQWTEPTFSSIDSKVGLHKYCWEEVKFSYDFHTLNTMSNIMNVLQSFAYAFSFLFFAVSTVRDKENRSIVLTIGFIGGFLFSILWEASGRYAFPYFMLLIPLASGAAGTVMNLFEEKVLSKIKKKDGTTDGKSC